MFLQMANYDEFLHWHLIEHNLFAIYYWLMAFGRPLSPIRNETVCASALATSPVRLSFFSSIFFPVCQTVLCYFVCSVAGRGGRGGEGGVWLFNKLQQVLVWNCHSVPNKCLIMCEKLCGGERLAKAVKALKYTLRI